MKKLIFLLPLILSMLVHGQTFNVKAVARPQIPTIFVSSNTLTPLTANFGTASSANVVQVSAILLVTAGTVTPVSGHEVSKDNITYASSLTLPITGGGFTGQNPTIPIYDRLSGSASVGAHNGSMTIVAGTASQSIVTNGTVNASVPTISITGSYGAFTTTTGVASADQTITASGSNLTANVAVTWPTGFEGSIDGGGTWAASQTLTRSGSTLAGQPVNVKTRLTSSATGTPSGNVHFTSTGATAVDVAVSGTVSSGASLDSLRVNFVSATSGNSQSGWTNLVGDPSVGILTGTGGITNSISVSTVSTSNWATFGGVCSFHDNGSGGTFLNYAPNVGKDVFYTGSFGTFSLSFPQIQLTGLLPGHHYSIAFYSSYTFSTTPNNIGLTDYRAYNGTTIFGPVSFDGQASNAHGNYKGGTQTLTGLLPDGSGNLSVYISIGTSADFTATAAFILKKDD